MRRNCTAVIITMPCLSSEAVESDQKSADYEFGQVSGSLFPTPPAGSGSLSALFSSAAPAPLLFIPAPKVNKETSSGMHRSRLIITAIDQP